MYKFQLRNAINLLEIFLPVIIQYYLKVSIRKIRTIKSNLYSSEIAYRNQLLDQTLDKSTIPYFLDIGASDGISNSNTYDLAKNKWSGLSIEGNNIKFKVLNRTLRLSNVKSVNEFVFSSNISSILRASGCQKEFDFLSLDIDSFEYSVLNQILIDFKPRLICVEINERFPPPIIFHIKEGVDASLIKDAFYGFSIQAAYNVFKIHGYKVVGLHYNNVYAVPNSSNLPEVDIFKCYKAGYVNAINRKQFFYWNKSYDFLLEKDPQQIIHFFDEQFKDLKQHYNMHLN